MQLTEMKKIAIIFSVVLINVSIGLSQAHVFHLFKLSIHYTELIKILENVVSSIIRLSFEKLVGSASMSVIYLPIFGEVVPDL